MRKILLFILFLTIVESVFAQGKFDRKIIIIDSTFYGVEIINQVGVLWVGNIAKPMDSAVQYILPVGTKRRSINLQPLAWDVDIDRFVAINFTENAQNDRATSLKVIELSNLEIYANEAQLKKYLNIAAQPFGDIENYPFIDTYLSHIYMDNLYFDLAVDGDSIYQFIVIDNKITGWFWDGKNWNKSETTEFNLTSFFSCFLNNHNVMLINGNGEHFNFANVPIPVESQLFDMVNTIMINNKGEEVISFVSKDAFANTALSLTQIINQNKIF